MNIIDVTLRDGGHQVDFNWSDAFVREHISVLTEIDQITYIELGYWKQTAKSKNPYYNLTESRLDWIQKHSGPQSLSKVSLMVDCHYCSHDPKDYPDSSFGVGLVRVCSRSEDITSAVNLGEKIKSRTGCKLSMNFFNITNYSEKDLQQCVSQAASSGADYIYFADTHGTLDLKTEQEKYRDIASLVVSHGIIPGFHLHDHSGKAYFNYRHLPECGFGSTDASLVGIGKGDGNLPLETILNPNDCIWLYDHIEKYRGLLAMSPSCYGIISSYYSITDYYALQARTLNLLPSEFFSLANQITGLQKDNFCPDALLK